MKLNSLDLTDNEQKVIEAKQPVNNDSINPPSGTITNQEENKINQISQKEAKKKVEEIASKRWSIKYNVSSWGSEQRDNSQLYMKTSLIIPMCLDGFMLKKKQAKFMNWTLAMIF
jgi:hypothetical protein